MIKSYDPGTITVERVLISSYVKYNRLNQLIAHAFTGSNATSINIYLDIYGISKTLFSRTYRTDVSEYTAYTAGLINMCGHYRQFFKYIGVHTNIYLVFGYNLCDYNMRLVNGYNKTFVEKKQNKVVTGMVEQNNELLETLVPFLNDIYFLKTDFETSVLIDYLIRNGDGNPNLIISKDIYPCQLTYLHPNTSFIKPKKLDGEDLSLIIPPIENNAYINDFWIMYCLARGSNNIEASMDTVSKIHPINFTMLSALNRFPERDMKTMYNITTAVDLISSVVGNNPIPVHTDSIVNAGQTRKGKRKLKIPEQILMNRHHSLDVEFMRPVYDESVESKMIHLINMTDPDSVRLICSTYFKNNPIDLGLL